MIPTPGYWIECSRQKIASDTIWDESESERDDDGAEGGETEGNDGGMDDYRRHDLLLEDDEDEPR